MSETSDSYMRIMKHEGEYYIRWGVRMDLEDKTILQPLEWRGDQRDGEKALKWVEDAAVSMIESGASSSLIDNLPRLDSLSTEILLRQADKLHEDWGILVFKHTGINAWFALIAPEDLFDDKTFTRAVGNEDMAIAIGELNVERACTSHRYNKEMKHHVIPRDEDGNYMSRTYEEQAERRPINRAKNRKWKEAFDQWHGSPAWNAKIQEWKGGMPKGGVPDSPK